MAKKPQHIYKLEDKYARLAGELIDHEARAQQARKASAELPALEGRVARLRADIEHIEKALQVFRPDWNAVGLAPIRPTAVVSPFARGVVQRHAMKMLRLADGLTVRDMIDDLLRTTGEAVDADVRQSLVCTLSNCLRRSKEQGIVVWAGEPRQWTLVRRSAGPQSQASQIARPDFDQPRH